MKCQIKNCNENPKWLLISDDFYKTLTDYNLQVVICEKHYKYALKKYNVSNPKRLENVFPLAKPISDEESRFNWLDIYKDSKCEHPDCDYKAKYLFLVGEADTPVCKEHFELAKKELSKVYTEL